MKNQHVCSYWLKYTLHDFFGTNYRADHRTKGNTITFDTESVEDHSITRFDKELVYDFFISLHQSIDSYQTYNQRAHKNLTHYKLMHHLILIFRVPM